MSGYLEDWARRHPDAAEDPDALTAEELAELYKLWARDTEPPADGYAVLSVLEEDLFFTITADDLCDGSSARYEDESGVEVLALDCGLKINGLNATRAIIRYSQDGKTFQQYEYSYTQGSTVWILALSTYEANWRTYEPIFKIIAGSFRADPDDEPVAGTGVRA
jgi:hypothetical protein